MDSDSSVDRVELKLRHNKSAHLYRPAKPERNAPIPSKISNNQYLNEFHHQRSPPMHINTQHTPTLHHKKYDQFNSTEHLYVISHNSNSPSPAITGNNSPFGKSYEHVHGYISSASDMKYNNRNMNMNININHHYQEPTYKTYTVEFKFNHQKMDMEFIPYLNQTGAVVVSCYSPFCKEHIKTPSLIVSINDKTVATMLVQQVFDILSITSKPYSITFHLCDDLNININILQNLKESNENYEKKEIEPPINLLKNKSKKKAKKSKIRTNIFISPYELYNERMIHPSGGKSFLFGDITWSHIDQEERCHKLNVQQCELYEIVIDLYNSGNKCEASQKTDEFRGVFRGVEFSLTCNSTGKDIFDVERKPKGEKFAVTIGPGLVGGKRKEKVEKQEHIRRLAYTALRKGTCIMTERGWVTCQYAGGSYELGKSGTTLFKYKQSIEFQEVKMCKKKLPTIYE